MDNNLTNINGKLREGDQEAYVFLFRKYYVPLCSYSRRYVGRKDVAEEIVSETFFNLWRNRASLEIHSSVKGYLFHAVLNNSLNHLRKLKKEERLEDYFRDASEENIGFMMNGEEISSDSLILKDLATTIDQAVDRLPPQQQAVFRLKRYEGKKLAEIAAVMGISVKTVEMHLAKAMLTLRKSLKEYLPAFILYLLLESI
ncbi:MAG: RNA polymerase sigma-70 factor [Prolixibacteraceae bacterium]